jgi:hypothetical protein
MRDMAKNANLTRKKSKSLDKEINLHKIAPCWDCADHNSTTGRKNVQSINNYAVASVEMQKTMSDILSNKEASESCVSTCSPPPKNPPPVRANPMSSIDISSNSSFRQ